MITISIFGRKATILKTAELPSGNDSSIKVNFIFTENDPVWKGMRKVAIFTAITPTGMRKSLPAVIDKNGEAEIPGKILSTPFSNVSAGVMAKDEDGSTFTTNLALINKTSAGAGGDNIFDNQELPIDKSDFDIFLAELAASFDTEIVDIKSDIKKMKSVSDSLSMDDSGSLQVNGESVMGYADYFHLMSRQSDAFKVERYWDLLDYSYTGEETDPDTGEKYETFAHIDLRPGTKEGDTAFVQRPGGNYVEKTDVENLLDFMPSINTVYPVIHFWQSDLPKVEVNGEAYAQFVTKSGTEYTLSVRYEEDFGAVIAELNKSDMNGSFYYSWEDTEVLSKGHFRYIEHGKLIPEKNQPRFWPIATDVKCIGLENPDALIHFMFNHDPINYHPMGQYIYDEKKQRWKIQVNSSYTVNLSVSKNDWSWDNRTTCRIGGVVPTDEIKAYCFGSDVKFEVVNIGYGHVTLESSEPVTEDKKIHFSVTHTVERNDTYGLWSEW